MTQQDRLLDLQKIIQDGLQSPFWKWISEMIDNKITSGMDKAFKERDRDKFREIMTEVSTLREVRTLPQNALREIQSKLIVQQSFLDRVDRFVKDGLLFFNKRKEV